MNASASTEESGRPFGNQKVAQRDERELCRKAVLAFLKAEELDCISVDVWISALPGIKKLLNTGTRQRNLSESCCEGAESSTEESWRSIYPVGQDTLLWPVSAKS